MPLTPPSSSATIGIRTRIGVWNGAAFVDFAEIIKVNPPSLKRDYKEVTNMLSPGGFREFVMGLTDPGELQFSVNWLISVSDPIYAALLVGITQYQLTFPNGVKFQSYGGMSGYNGDAPLDGVMTAVVTIKFSGQPIWVP